MEPLKLELEHFIECITEKKKPLVTGSDGVKALKIAEAIMASFSKKLFAYQHERQNITKLPDSNIDKAKEKVGANIEVTVSKKT